MSFRQGIVVDTHPGDNAVDLVMADTGERLIGVKVMTPDGSARTGGINLPEVQPRKNKWDVSEQTDQDMIAVVGYVGRQPIVTGFIYPPEQQIGTKDKRTLFRRHQSDVQWSIDGLGNVQLQHPSGAYVRIGETPDQENVATAQPSAIDRNKGRKVNVRIGLADNMVIVTLTPDGDMKVAVKRDVTVDADGAIRMSAKKTITLEADQDISIKSGANVTVNSSGNTTVTAGGDISLSATGNATVSAGGVVNVNAKSSVTITAPAGATINTPLLNVSGEVIASDYHKR